MIEIKEEERPWLYKLCKLLYRFYTLVYGVKASDQKTHWNICYFAIALFMAPLYWVLKQVGWMLLLCLLGCVMLHDAILESKGSIKSFGVDFAGSIKNIIDDSGDSYNSFNPSKAIAYLWVTVSIGSLGYLCFQYPKLMLASVAILIGAVLLVRFDDALSGTISKIQQTIDNCCAEISQKASEAYHRTCPCVKIVPATSSSN